MHGTVDPRCRPVGGGYDCTVASSSTSFQFMYLALKTGTTARFSVDPVAGTRDPNLANNTFLLDLAPRH